MISGLSTYYIRIDKKRVFSELARSLANREDVWTSEYRLKKANGEWAYTRERGYILQDATGKLVRMIGCSEDITTQKLAQCALIESEKSYKKLFNSAPLPQVIYDTGSAG